ncbi:hypothetical protein FBU59_003612, partial [Linderina macrospora]
EPYTSTYIEDGETKIITGYRARSTTTSGALPAFRVSGLISSAAAALAIAALF